MMSGSDKSHKMRRALAAMLPLAMLGVILVGLIVPTGGVSAENIPPINSDFAIVDDYWPMELTGPGTLVYASDPDRNWYMTASADGSIAATYDNGIGDLNWGSEVDRRFTVFWKPDYGVWDLGTSFSRVAVFQYHDHPDRWPLDPLHYVIWGSNDFNAAKPGAATWVQAAIETLYREGWSNVGDSERESNNDDGTAVWSWPDTGESYRFVKLMSIFDTPYIDPEIDAVKGVPEGVVPPPAECGWQSSILERGRTYSYTSLEVDSDNRTRIAFGEEQLYYAILEGSTWQVQMVEQGGVGAYCSLALGAAGQTGIGYYDSANGNLKYALQTGTTWSIQTVDTVGNVGTHTSLAFDGLGRPCISYYDETNANLKYAHWSGSAWIVEVADSVGWVGQYTSLAFDGAGLASISYYDATNESLKYAHWNGSTWGTSTVDPGDNDVGRFTSLAFDGSGNPAISYLDVTHGDLKYAQWSGTSWQLTRVDDDGWIGEYTSLAFDSLGRPAISYYDAEKSDLKCARWTGTAWKIARVDDDGAVGMHTSLGFDLSDGPVVSYYDATLDTIHCAHWITGWEKETLTGVPWPGRFTSLDFDSEGDPGISYYDPMNGDLKYAHWEGEYWTWEDNIWSVQTIDSSGDVGRYTSLTFDSFDNPCISYYDVTGANLKYARWNGIVWEISTVDSAGDVGSYSSLELDSSDNPSISYYDATNGDLRYCRWNGTSWDYTNVDSLGDVGRYSSLAIDDILDYPAIAYYDAANGDLRYARWDGSAWNTETVDSAGDVGSFACLAFDCSGIPGMSYHDATNGDLKYAHWGGTAWVIEVVDSSGWAGSHTALVFDAFDNPTISYHEASDGDLRYAHWNGLKWEIESVDVSDWAGRYTSIAFDGCGQPFISYDGATNGDLKYAYIRNSAPHQPVNELPADGADRLDVDAVTLGASLFSDPCIDSHRASQWQVTTMPGDYCTPVFDSGVDRVNLLRISIPPGVLDDYTTYYWHVRYQDCHGAWSEYSEETSFSTGAPPYQPVNTSPVDGVLGVATAPMLVASAFSDPEPGDTHAGSQWQITTSSGDYASPVFDKTTQGTDLTQIRLASGVLGTSTTYYWRVRYQDSHGAWSVFSTETSFTTAAIVKNPPYQPTNISPLDGASGVSLTPNLEGSEFSDADPDDTHAASQWRITSNAGDYASPVFDSGRILVNLTTIVVPSQELSPDTAYYWQVRYQDSQGDWSEWSTETGFTTAETPEEAAPEEGGVPIGLVIAATVISVIILGGIAAPLMLPL